ncbi:hypothetical protein Bca52824_035994 [Brassica carinata]|uniref:14-3-3 domain-containing protein n=1 Tax=Brassica carinata TaxID=52824 RepID=A0A8X7V2A8_BRACI|nr:hypothetical protein Bca52824_035994 [Brassica carinata]
MSSRKQNIYLAKLADDAEQYNDMVEFMDKVAKTAAELTPEERNLLSIAYKNLIAGRRASLKRIRSIEKKETKKGNTDNVSFIKDHRVKIETEINNICDRIFNLIDSHLLPNASTDDSKVFYLKMKGDYHRYLSDSKTGPARVQAAKDTLEIYKSAKVIALNLPSLTYRDWGLLLTCLFSTMRPSCQLRLRAYDAAITELHAVREESFEDTVLIMHLIRDRVTLWTDELRCFQ